MCSSDLGQPEDIAWGVLFLASDESSFVTGSELVIDVGKVRGIRGFRYLARQDGGWNGAFAKTEFSISDSPDVFSDPVVQATFKKVRTAQTADCAKPVRGRYVRVRILSEVNGQAWGSAAEIGIIGN